MGLINTSQSERLASAYMTAKETVIRSGFAWEIDWQADLSFEDLTESIFLRELAWVVLCSGMRESVVRKIFPAITSAFLNWEAASNIVRHRSNCQKKAMATFSHAGKINAIIRAAEKINAKGFSAIKTSILTGGLKYIEQFQYMGPATSMHLAKNLGMPIVKPDRHLTRVAQIAGFQTPQDLCSAIALLIGDKLAVIDIVIWRYATLNPNYLSLFNV